MDRLDLVVFKWSTNIRKSPFLFFVWWNENPFFLLLRCEENMFGDGIEIKANQKAKNLAHKLVGMSRNFDESVPCT